MLFVHPVARLDHICLLITSVHIDALVIHADAHAAPSLALPYAPAPSSASLPSAFLQMIMSERCRRQSSQPSCGSSDSPVLHSNAVHRNWHGPFLTFSKGLRQYKAAPL